MTELQTLLIREGEVKARNVEISLMEGEAVSEEIRAEGTKLSTEYLGLQTRIKAARIADPTTEVTDDAEGRELRALMFGEDGANLGDVCRSVMEQRSIDGATAELQAAFGLGTNQFPVEALRTEARAVAVVPGDNEAGQQPIVQPVFAEGDAAFLMVNQTVVPEGSAVFPTLSTRPTVGGPHADSTSVGDTTATFVVSALDPSRLQAQFFYRTTDSSRFPGLDPSLRGALGSGLSEAVDKAFIAQVVTDVARTDATAENTFATYRSALVYGRLDGRHASMESAVRLLMGSPTLAHAAGKYRSNNSDDSAADSLRRISGGIKISPHVAAVSGHKQDVIVRLGMLNDAAIGIWSGVTIIDDPYTKAKTGERVLTGVLQCAFSVTRAAGFARIQVQHQ